MDGFIRDLVILILCEIAVVFLLGIAGSTWELSVFLLALLFMLMMSVLTIYFGMKVCYRLFRKAKQEVLSDLRNPRTRG